MVQCVTDGLAPCKEWLSTRCGAVCLHSQIDIISMLIRSTRRSPGPRCAAGVLQAQILAGDVETGRICEAKEIPHTKLSPAESLPHRCRDLRFLVEVQREVRLR